MKRIVIIVYDGKNPPPQAQKDAAGMLAQYGLIDNLENVEVYVLDEAEMVAAIAGKALSGNHNNIVFEKPEEWAAKMVINDFLEALSTKDYDTFSVALSIRLSSELMRGPETDFMRAIRILTKEHAENNITDAQRACLDDRVFQIMRRSFYLVCQGRHIVFR
jgi:hypothetical protein